MVKTSYLLCVMMVLLYSNNLIAMQSFGAQDDWVVGQRTVKPPKEVFLPGQPSLDSVVKSSYPEACQRHSINFERGKALCNSDEQAKKDRGLALLRKIAGDEEHPFPPAQFELAKQLGPLKKKASYPHFRDAAFNQFPPAEAQFGCMLIDRGYEDLGIKMLHNAVEPREVKFLDRKNGKRCVAHYQEPLAAEMLAELYAQNAMERLSEDSFHFTDLAFKLTRKQKWADQMGDLLIEAAHVRAFYEQRMILLNYMSAWAAQQINFYPLQVTQGQQQPIELHQQREPEPLSAQDCIAQLEAAGMSKDTDPLIMRLRQLAESDDNALRYILITHAKQNHGVTQDVLYVSQLLERVKEQNLFISLTAEDQEALRLFAQRSKDAALNYQLGKLFHERAQVAGNKGNVHHKAIACLSRVPSDVDFYTDAQWRLFNCYVKNKQPERAVAIIKPFMDSDDCRDYVQQIGEALEVLEDTFSNKPMVAFFLAEVFAAGVPGVVDGNEKKSSLLYEAAAKLNHSGALIKCGEAEMYKGQLTEAFNLLDRATELSAFDRYKDSIIECMERLAAKGSVEAAVWLFNQLKHENLPAALKWLSEQLVLATRSVFENNVTIGVHRDQHAVHRISCLSQKIGRSIVRELEDTVQVIDDPVLKDNIYRVLGCLAVLKSGPIADQRRQVQCLEKAHGFLVQLKKEKTAYLLKKLAEQIGFFYDEIGELAQAEKYFRLAYQRGSEAASKMLLCLLIKKHTVGTAEFARGLDLADEMVKSKPEIALYVIDHFKPADDVPELEQRVNKLLVQAATHGCFFAAFLLHVTDVSFAHAKADELQEQFRDQLAQDDGDACYQVGMAFYLQKNYAQAAEFLARAHRAHHPFAQFYLAYALIHLGQLQEVHKHFGEFLLSVENTGLESAMLKEQAEETLDSLAKRGSIEAFKLVSDYYVRQYKEKRNASCIIKFKALIAELIIPQWLNSEQKCKAELLACLPYLQQMAQIDDECAWHQAAILLRIHLKKIRFPEFSEEHAQIEGIRALFNQAHRKAPSFTQEEHFRRSWADCLTEFGLSCEQRQKYSQAAEAYHEALKIVPAHVCVSKLASLYFKGRTPLKGTESWQRGIGLLEDVARNGNTNAAARLAEYYRVGVKFACGGVRLRPDKRKAAHYQKLVPNNDAAQESADTPNGSDNNPLSLLKLSATFLNPSMKNVDQAFKFFKASLDA